jgi:hypothetical protein
LGVVERNRYRFKKKRRGKKNLSLPSENLFLTSSERLGKIAKEKKRNGEKIIVKK